MKTWRIEFTEEELAEIYYAVLDKSHSMVTEGDNKWRRQLKKIGQKIVDSGAHI